MSRFPANHSFAGKWLFALWAFQIPARTILNDFVFEAFNQTTCTTLLIFIKEYFTLATVDFYNVKRNHTIIFLAAA